MGVEFFLGEPPAHIKQWIIDNSQPSNPDQPSLGFWEQIVKNLETEPSCEKKAITSTDKLVAGVLPSVGSTIPVQYKIDANGDAVSTEWMVLGYNSSIPSRVKYVNGNNVVYVATTSGGLLAQIAAGTSVYSDKITETSSGIVASVGSEPFVYGNNCTYTVPTTVTVDGVEYSFAGYNMTIQSRAILITKYDGDIWNKIAFHRNTPYRNDWASSEIRDWLNTNGTVASATWFTDGNSQRPNVTGVIDGFLGRLSDTFLNSVCPTVNRTWVFRNFVSGKTLDENQCEHVVDRFLLLGFGNVNYNGYNSKSDVQYDTSIFSDIFTENTTISKDRIRYQMSEDGGVSSVAG